MGERQSRRQACQVCFPGTPLFQKKWGEIIEPRKKDQNLTFHCVYLDDILYKWSAKWAAKDKQLFPTSHWFTWSTCVISWGLQYITSVFFLPCLRYASVFLAWSKKTAGSLEEQKKQQPTNQKPNIFFKEQTQKPPTRRKLLEVPTSRHPGNSLIWPHLMTVKLFFCLFCRGVVPSIRVY